ncbi:MAG: UDP-glucose dehydrogenase family protein [Clostridia bacterium]
MRISIIGTGYVGLVSGVCLASKGHEVICVDNRADVVESINSSKATIYEPYLSEYIKEAVKAGKLSATIDLKHAVNNSEISIIAVGTPYKEDDIDLSYIEKVSQDIGRLLREKEAYHVVCIKSTVIPTTTDTFVKNIIELESGKKAGEFGLVMNPEFLREGEALMDFLHPDRIVIGAYDDKSFEVFRKVYENYFEAPIIRVSLRTAELIKYASNSLLAMLISYSNEIAAISEVVGSLDVEEVLYGVSLDKRFSPKIDGKLVRPDILKYLKAGRGYGGSCFPKDVKALIAFSEKKGYIPQLLRATAKINEKQVAKVVDRIESELGEIEGRRILVLGLAFKQNSDDIRESPSIGLVKLLIEKKATVMVTDPMAVENTRIILGEREGLYYLENYKSEASSLDAVVLMTPWQEYVELLSEGCYVPLKTAILFDVCRALNKNKILEAGIKYIGVGLS